MRRAGEKIQRPSQDERTAPLEAQLAGCYGLLAMWRRGEWEAAGVWLAGHPRLLPVLGMARATGDLRPTTAQMAVDETRIDELHEEHIREEVDADLVGARQADLAAGQGMRFLLCFLPGALGAPASVSRR